MLSVTNINIGDFPGELCPGYYPIVQEGPISFAFSIWRVNYRPKKYFAQTIRSDNLQR
jgi:hypothetical protein